MKRLLATAWLASYLGLASTLDFHVPKCPPANASPQLSVAPVGVSLEFFAFPGYVTDVPSTQRCLQNLKDLTGTWPPLRIGGTTQDRATYDATSTQAVTYSVADPNDAPQTLTFGPKLISLASEYGGRVTLGLNRRLNNLANTIAAARLAKDSIPNLHAVELGNEPNFFSKNDPIAQGSAWDPAADYRSQVAWQDDVCGNLSSDALISAGVYFGTAPMSINGLTAVEGDANRYVKQYCSHNYPQSKSTADLPKLMGHSSIATQISPFRAEIAAANSKNRPHVFGETNSATQGGGGISQTYGAALWILDYVMQNLIMGTEALYFHQGTIGNCAYCWWGKYTVGAPYYGAYFATLALAGAEKIAPLDDQTTPYAAYAIYKAGRPAKVLLYNSDYYISGGRSQQSFTLTGLSASTVTAKRLTAPSSTARVDRGASPSIAGQIFENGSCVIKGQSKDELVPVVAGVATFTLEASEALLVYL